MFSVIVLTHKLPSMLAECLESIAKTNGGKVREVIVVNDGGPDEIQNIANSFKSKLNIKYIKNSSNKGISHSRNEGIKAAEGSYITIFADNYTVRPDHFMVIEKHLEKYDTVASNIITVGQGIGPKAYNHYYNFVIDGWTKSAFKTEQGYEGGNFPAGAASSFKRKAIEDTGWFDTSLRSSEDTDYNLRLDKENKKRLYATDIVVYRHETDGLFRTLKKQYSYGKTIHQFREKYNQPLVAIAELKHAMHVVSSFYKSTRNRRYLPIIALIHFTYRMGIVVQILKRGKKAK